LIFLSGRPLQHGLFNGLIWPEAGFALIAYAAMAPIDFLPLPATPSFLAKQQSRLAAILRWRCGPGGCVVDRLRPVDRHRGRNGAGSKPQIKEN
jgi:hypothetical protein